MKQPETKRICHIITRLSLGGAQENTLFTVEGLMKRPDFSVDLVVGEDDGAEGELITRAKNNGVNVISVPNLRRKIDPAKDLAAYSDLVRLFKSKKYHLVHTHMSKAGALGRLAARKARVPFVVHTLHSLVYHQYQPKYVNLGYRMLKKFLARYTDYYISVSRILGEQAVKDGIVPADRWATVYSGMEMDWFAGQPRKRAEIRKSLGIPEQSMVVGKVARLFDLKGHKELWEAIPLILREMPETRFVMVGDGALRQSLEREAERLGFGRNIIFTGFVQPEEVPQVMGAFDVLVHTSLREGIARVLPQALAMGIPCVAYNLDGAPEVVLDGQTGFLTEPGDAEGLSQAVTRLLKDPALREKMGGAGQKHVLPMFAVNKMVSDIETIYDNLFRKMDAPGVGGLAA